MPFIIYVLFAAGMGWAIQKKKIGIAVVCGSIMVWLLLMQIIIAYSMHPISN